MLVDSEHNGGDEDLIMWVNLEQLCCVCETIIRLYFEDTLIKKIKNFKHNSYYINNPFKNGLRI